MCGSNGCQKRANWLAESCGKESHDERATWEGKGGWHSLDGVPGLYSRLLFGPGDGVCSLLSRVGELAWLETKCGAGRTGINDGGALAAGRPHRNRNGAR